MASLAAKRAASTIAGAAAAAFIPKGRGVPLRVATGIVTRAGTCEKTVRVRLGGETWNQKVKKYFKKPQEHLCHDPNNSLREGDVVEVQASYRSSKTKRFVVNKIVAPFGLPIHERPPVPTPDERAAAKAVKREAKKSRKELRQTRERLEAQFTKSDRLLQREIEDTTKLSAALRERVGAMGLGLGQTQTSSS